MNETCGYETRSMGQLVGSCSRFAGHGGAHDTYMTPPVPSEGRTVEQRHRRLQEEWLSANYYGNAPDWVAWLEAQVDAKEAALRKAEKREQRLREELRRIAWDAVLVREARMWARAALTQEAAPEEETDATS